MRKAFQGTVELLSLGVFVAMVWIWAALGTLPPV